MLKWMGGKLKALHSDEQGADMVEYVLIVAAVALPLLAGAASTHLRGEGYEGTDPRGSF
jgi:Flp pilus assembly pilin Flp